MSWWSRRRSRPGRRRCWPPSANTCPTPRSPTGCTSPCAPSRATSRRCCASSAPTTAGRWPAGRRGRRRWPRRRRLPPAGSPGSRAAGPRSSAGRGTWTSPWSGWPRPGWSPCSARAASGRPGWPRSWPSPRRPSYPAGGAFVDLVPVRAGFLVPTVAAALGVTDRPPRSLEDAVVEAARAPGGHCSCSTTASISWRRSARSWSGCCPSVRTPRSSPRAGSGSG